MSTTAAENAFFSQPENQSLLQRFSRDLASAKSEYELPEGSIRTLKAIIDMISKNTQAFDLNTRVNIEWIGDQFINEIIEAANKWPNVAPLNMQHIFSMGYRFMCEIDFVQEGDPSFDLRNILKLVQGNLESYPNDLKQQVIYATYFMPANMAKKMVNYEGVSTFRDIEMRLKEAQKLKESWDADFNKRITLIEALKANIEKATSSYNFVGLVNGFKDLRNAKNIEKWVSVTLIFILAAAMIAVPGIYLDYLFNNETITDKWNFKLVYFGPPVIGLELILLYFFKVVLAQYRSTKGQLLQIDLRVTLCQFIESYSDYVESKHSKNPNALTKFESIIFSGLLVDEGELPSSFDGIEQLASLIKSVKSSA